MNVFVTSEILKFIAPPYKSNTERRDRQSKNISNLPFYMNKWFSVYGINENKLRVAHFLAQSCHETGGFLDLKEISDGKKYAFGTRIGEVLGNTKPGDGPKYIGRGLMHLTGRYNYEKYGKEIDQDIINHPDMVSSDYSIAVQTACVFWERNSLNYIADKDDFNEICRVINGGTNGKNSRMELLIKAKKTLVAN